MIRRPPRSTPLYSSAASDVYKRQIHVRDDEIERIRLLCENPPGFLAACVGNDPITEFLKGSLHYVGDRFFVVNQHDSLGAALCDPRLLFLSLFPGGAGALVDRQVRAESRSPADGARHAHVTP